MCYILLKQVINLILASKMMLNIFPVSSSWTCTEYSQLFVMSTAIHTVHVFTLVPQVQSLSYPLWQHCIILFTGGLGKLYVREKRILCMHTVAGIQQRFCFYSRTCAFKKKKKIFYTCVGTCGFLVFVSSVFVSPLLTLSVLLQHCALLL